MIVIVPLDSEVMGTLFPSASERLEPGVAVNMTGIIPVALGEASKTRCPSPSVAPDPTVVPELIIEKLSEASNVCPKLVLILGPKRLNPLKM